MERAQMVTPAHRAIQDQNLNSLYNGATPGCKNNIKGADKKGGLGGRKALNDISNSRVPPLLQSIKKNNSKNVISIGKDSSDAKPRLSRAPEKTKIGGRKPLTDLTNSGEPRSQQVQRTARKLTSVAEESALTCIAEEGFLHDHEKCIQAQTKVVDKDYFLKSVGLHIDMSRQQSANRSFLSSSKQPESNLKHLKIEEIPDKSFQDDTQLDKSSGGPNCSSPTCKSPISSPPPYGNWEEDSASYLTTIETPKPKSPLKSPMRCCI